MSGLFLVQFIFSSLRRCLFLSDCDVLQNAAMTMVDVFGTIVFRSECVFNVHLSTTVGLSVRIRCTVEVKVRIGAGGKSKFNVLGLGSTIRPRPRPRVQGWLGSRVRVVVKVRIGTAAIIRAHGSH